MSDETKVTEEQVYEEHLKAVNVPAHWAYFFGVMLVGLVLMLLVITLLGASAG